MFCLSVETGSTSCSAFGQAVLGYLLCMEGWSRHHKNLALADFDSYFRSVRTIRLQIVSGELVSVGTPGNGQWCQRGGGVPLRLL